MVLQRSAKEIGDQGFYRGATVNLPIAMRPLVSGSYSVLDHQRRIGEVSRPHCAHDIGEGEVLDAAFEVECGDKAVVALFGVDRLGQLGQP
jgi:hypothetical protein